MLRKFFSTQLAIVDYTELSCSENVKTFVAEH